jgi:hypothetical protein
MSSAEKRRVAAKLWSLEQAAVRIETRGDVTQSPIYRRIKLPSTIEELRDALLSGAIRASGCVDGGERRTISPADWSDYRLTVKYSVFTGRHFTGRPGVMTIEVLSIRSFPAAALTYHVRRSKVRTPFVKSHDGEAAYYRVITDVLLPQEQVVKQWPASDSGLSTADATKRSSGRSRPPRERALVAIQQLYPGGTPSQVIEPNAILCRRVGTKLKEFKLPNVSDDTILRAAGRRK